MDRFAGAWRQVRTVVGAILLRNPWRLRKARRAQRAALAAADTATRRAIVFLMPGHDGVTGGILSMNSLIEESARLEALHGARVYACVFPAHPPLARYTRFDNALALLDFDDLIAALAETRADILLQMPEYFVAQAAAGRCAAAVRARGLRLQVNILLQNIDQAPSPDDVLRMKAFGEVTITTAHKAYATPQTAARLGCRLFHLSTFVAPERYPRLAFAAKKKLVMVSPDPHPLRGRVLEALRRALPDHEFKVVRRMAYPDYRALCAQAKFSLTFGEGLDGYYIETIFSGGVACAVFNARFFPERYRGAPLLFETWEALIAEAPSRLRGLDAAAPYAAMNAAQFDLVSEDYVQAEYLANIRDFYSRGVRWGASADSREDPGQEAASQER